MTNSSSNSTLITSPVDGSNRQISQDVRPSFETAAGYQLLNRMAEVFCASKIVPMEYRANKANCMIACNMATRMGIDPVTVMQNLYVINGKPGWSSQFLIGMWNTCKRFTPIRYEWSPDRKSCRATSMDLKTQDVITGTTITMAMAKAEGWIDKPGSKWKTMPEQMLMYRAAAFMIRAYAAEIALGLMTVEETEDITGKHHLEYTEPAAVPTQAMLDQVIDGQAKENEGTPTNETQTAGKEEVIDVEVTPKEVHAAAIVTGEVAEKYTPTSPAEVVQTELAQPSAEVSAESPISDVTFSRLASLLKELAPDKDKWKASLKNKYGVDSARFLHESQADEVIKWLSAKVDAKRLNSWATGATQRPSQQQEAGATAELVEAAPFP